MSWNRESSVLLLLVAPIFCMADPVIADPAPRQSLATTSGYSSLPRYYGTGDAPRVQGQLSIVLHGDHATLASDIRFEKSYTTHRDPSTGRERHIGHTLGIVAGISTSTIISPEVAQAWAMRLVQSLNDD